MPGSAHPLAALTQLTEDDYDALYGDALDELEEALGTDFVLEFVLHILAFRGIIADNRVYIIFPAR